MAMMDKETLTNLMEKYDYARKSDGSIVFYTGWYEHSNREVHKYKEGFEPNSQAGKERAMENFENLYGDYMRDLIRESDGW